MKVDVLVVDGTGRTDEAEEARPLEASSGGQADLVEPGLEVLARVV
jgi:hypothetical protein